MNDDDFYEDLSSKMKLIYFYAENNKIIQNDPLFKQPLNLEEIRSISELDNTENIKYLYFNKENIDKALFEAEKEEVISITFDMVKKGLHNLFYLDLILNYNKEIMNYKFDKQFIKEIYKITIKESKNKFKQIILSKIIKDLINYYIKTEYYDEDKDSIEFEEFNNKTSQIINSNITIFKSLKLDFTDKDILTKEIDILYKEIIHSLIKLKFNDNTIDIFEQLDLENIILNNSIILDELWNILMSSDFKNYFEVNDENGITDLFNSQKIQFFYIIFKYIFKSNFYIIKEKLFELRKKLDRIISKRQNREIFFNEYKKQNYIRKEQLFFTLNSLLMLSRNYYYKLFFKEILNKDPYILLNNSYFKYTINKKKENESHFDNFQFIYLSKENYTEIPKHLRVIPEIVSFLNDFKEKIEKKCNNNYKLIITLKLNIVGEIEGKGYNMNCIYELERLGFDPDDDNIVKKYKDENILVNGLSEGCEFLIEEINDEYYNQINNNN